MKQLEAWQEIVQPTTVNGVSIRLPEYILYTDKYMVSVRWNWDSGYWIARIYWRDSKQLWWIMDQVDTLQQTRKNAMQWVADNESV